MFSVGFGFKIICFVLELAHAKLLVFIFVIFNSTIKPVMVSGIKNVFY